MKLRINSKRIGKLAAMCASSVALILGSASCDQINARRTIQDGDELYQDGEYNEAIEAYEHALSKSDIDTAHHNLAIAAYKAFQPGVQTEANERFAKKAAEHFEAYLKAHPDDEQIVDLLTTLWLDSDNYDEAEAYWLKILANKPNDPAILKKLRTINQQAGRHEKALEWDEKRVLAAPDDESKSRVYRDMAQLQYSRLTKLSLLDGQRIQVADSGIAALKKALELKPDANDIYGLMATLYQFRSLAHYTTWGQTIDTASQSLYQLKHRERMLAASGKAPEAPEKKDQSESLSDTEPAGEAQ